MSRRRKLVYKNRRKRKIYFSLLLVCVLLIGLGYSNLVSNLNINGTLSIWKYDKTLYGVLERAAKIGTYARKYTGAHQDSMLGDGDKEIYHWYASTDTNGTAILDKNNVIFAGHCWQMIRTTDTGGVKMIYNGEVENNQCLNTRGTHVGYGSRTLQNLSGSYYYGTSYRYDSVNNVFYLTGILNQETWNESNVSNIVGKYTCLSTSDTGTCATLYLIESYSNETSGYALAINSNSPYSQFGNLPFNVAIDSLAYTGYMYNTIYSTQTKTLDATTYKYASDFTYSNGAYTLNSDSVSFAGSSDSDIESLSTHHYTCWNTTGTCSSISYVYLYDAGVLSYISFADGKNINDAINDMISNNGVNVKNSIMKTGVESWYASHLEPYSSYLEDAVYCNRRTVWTLGAWNPNGGTVLKSAYPWLLLTGADPSYTILSCPNVTDQFTTTNSLANSSYKIGLITRPELALLNSDNARASADIYYILSPYGFMDVASIRRVNPPGDIGSTQPTSNMGVRPVISLVYGTEYVSGDGSMTNPYIVDMTQPDTLMLHDSDANNTFGKSISRDSFESITTVNHISVPGTAIDSWDASNNQNGSVLAWYTDSDSDGKYELYLGQEGGIKANIDSSNTFRGFQNIDSLDLTYFDTADVKNMSSMFHSTGYNSTVFTLDLGNHFDTSKVENFGGMFVRTGRSSSSFTLDLGDNFDTSSALNFGWMFLETGYTSTEFTLNLGSKFDTSKALNMDGMFQEAGYSSPVFTLNLGNNFDTSNVMSMRNMFCNSGYSSLVYTLDLGSNFDTSNVMNMDLMFYHVGHSSSEFTLDLGSKFDTSKVMKMGNMFHEIGYSSPVFTLSLGDKFDTSNVVDFNWMFYGAGYSSDVFTLDLGSKFNTSKASSMVGMFYNTGYSSTVFTLDLGSKFDTSNVTNMNDMFHGTGHTSPVFTLNLGSNFNTAKVISMERMFNRTGYSSTVFTLDLGNKFDTSHVTHMRWMFGETGTSNANFTLNLGDKFDTSRAVDMTSMFNNIGSANSSFSLDLGNQFVFTSVTDYNYIFRYWKTTNKLYVKSATERSWIISNGGNGNLTTSNVLIRS